jgi:hypothetical protein
VDGTEEPEADIVVPVVDVVAVTGGGARIALVVVPGAAAQRTPSLPGRPTVVTAIQI